MSRFDRGREMERRRTERERELESDARDRQKEKEELEELKSKIFAEGHSDPSATFKQVGRRHITTRTAWILISFLSPSCPFRLSTKESSSTSPKSFFRPSLSAMWAVLSHPWTFLCLRKTRMVTTPKCRSETTRRRPSLLLLPHQQFQSPRGTAPVCRAAL